MWRGENIEIDLITLNIRKKATACANSKAKYANNSDKKRSISCANSKAEYSANRENLKSSMSMYYIRNRESINAYKRDKYTLSEPKPVTKDAYHEDL